MYRCKGTITVFLSLVSILLLSLFCTMIESARVQGARAQAAANLDMGLYSVFGEYDKVLLEEYDLWFLDGTMGTSKFSKEGLETKLKDFIYPNLHPAENLTIGRYWNLFPMELDSCKVEKYALATDDGGRVFYRQVIENEKELAAGNLAADVLKSKDKLQEQQTKGEEYKKEEAVAEKKLEEAESEQENAENTLQDPQLQIEIKQPQPDANPLDTIKKIQKMGILGLVLKDPSKFSQKELMVKNLPSKRTLREGNLKVERISEGVVSETIFLNYLKRNFTCAVDKKKKDKLHCEMEYLVAGKTSDIENLKAIVNRLLLLREGTNFTCVTTSARMSKEAFALAGTIAGSLAVPALTTALQYALMLAWAYGESLMDMRILLAGGKVPLIKTEADWKLSLQNLGNLETVLEECDKGGGSGQSYEEYLLGFLTLEKKADRNLRVLDLIEAYRRSEKGGENFRADALIAEMKVSCTFQLQPVFLAVPAVFMKVSNHGIQYQIEGRHGYMEGGV